MLGLLLSIQIVLLFPADSLKVYPCRFDTLPNVVIYDFPEVEPSFPGGLQAMQAFIVEHFVYPQIENEMAIPTTTYIGFIVDITGEITCLEIRNKNTGDYNSLVDLELLRVMELMPLWIPGTNQGIPVPVKYLLPVSLHPSRW
jgi:periplasmic protein TonB